MGPICAPVTEPPKATDVPAMVMVPLPVRALFATEVAGKVIVPVKVGFALGAYVEDALVVVRYP